MTYNCELCGEALTPEETQTDQAFTFGFYRSHRHFRVCIRNLHWQLESLRKTVDGDD